MKYTSKTIANLTVSAFIIIAFFALPWLNLTDYYSLTACNALATLLNIVNEAGSDFTYYMGDSVGSLTVYFALLYAIIIPIAVGGFKLFADKDQEGFNKWCKYGYYIDIGLTVITYMIRAYMLQQITSYSDSYMYGLGSYVGGIASSIFQLGAGFYIIFFAGIAGAVIPYFFKESGQPTQAAVNTAQTVSEIYSSGRNAINQFTGRSKEDTGNLLPVIELQGAKDSIKISSLPATIGRERGEVDAYVFDNTISRKHALIDNYEGSIILTDLGSVYGTFVNDEKVIPNEYYLVEDRDKIKLGNLEFNVLVNQQLYDRKYPKQEEQPQTLEPQNEVKAQPVAENFNEPQQPAYSQPEPEYPSYSEPEVEPQIYSEPQPKPEPQIYNEPQPEPQPQIMKEPVDEPEVQIQTESIMEEPPRPPIDDQPVIMKEQLNPEFPEGFDRNKTIKLTPSINRNETIKLDYTGDEGDFPLVGLKSERDGSLLTIDKTPFYFGSQENEVDEVIKGVGISKKHFTIERSNGQFYITDLNSTNGTRLNDQDLKPFAKRPITPGDLITVSQKSYRFEKL